MIFTQAEVRASRAAEDVWMEREAPYKVGSMELLNCEFAFIVAAAPCVVPHLLST